MKILKIYRYKNKYSGWDQEFVYGDVLYWLNVAVENMRMYSHVDTILLFTDSYYYVIDNHFSLTRLNYI